MMMMMLFVQFSFPVHVSIIFSQKKYIITILQMQSNNFTLKWFILSLRIVPRVVAGSNSDYCPLSTEKEIKNKYCLERFEVHAHTSSRRSISVILDGRHNYTAPQALRQLHIIGNCPVTSWVIYTSHL